MSNKPRDQITTYHSILKGLSENEMRLSEIYRNSNLSSPRKRSQFKSPYINNLISKGFVTQHTKIFHKKHSFKKETYQRNTYTITKKGIQLMENLEIWINGTL